MNSDININDAAYDFFKQLSEPEKLLFLYDLLSEMIDEEESDDLFFNFTAEDAKELDLEIPSLNMLIKLHGQSLSKLIRSSILTDTYTNVLIINNYLVLNSQSTEAINNTIEGLFDSGMILTKVDLSENAFNTLKHQNFCKVYHIVGQGNRINYN
jgi:hypothetical protein